MSSYLSSSLSGHPFFLGEKFDETRVHTTQMRHTDFDQLGKYYISGEKSEHYIIQDFTFHVTNDENISDLKQI